MDDHWHVPVANLIRYPQALQDQSSILTFDEGLQPWHAANNMEES